MLNGCKHFSLFGWSFRGRGAKFCNETCGASRKIENFFPGLNTPAYFASVNNIETMFKNQ